MKRIGSVTWLSLAFFAFVAGLICLVWLPMRGGELYEKGRYAYLHRVASDYLDKAAQFAGNPLFLPRSSDRPYTVLGLPSNRDKTKYVWITLDEADEAIQRVTVVPAGEDLVLSCRYLVEIRSALRLARNTSDFLQSRCVHDIRESSSR